VGRYSYAERDYTFGQVMLTLRTSLGLTQVGLADLLGVSRRAVAEWEAGSSYPKADHLKQLIAVGIRASAFASGNEAEEIRTLWKAAHQKVLLDDLWLQGLLGQPPPPLSLLAPLPDEQTSETGRVTAPLVGVQRVDWGKALAVPTFYGREWEMDLLTRWVVEEHCRVVSVLGLGGVGKSALAVSLMHHNR
jgi:transcriptional regulator with XRE-family HTH domain